MTARVVVLSTLFPSEPQPHAGIFIHERMFRVGQHLPLTVISPQPWFPGQSLLRLFRPNYRLAGARSESSDGFDIFRPRFLALPWFGRRWDGVSMAVSVAPLLRKLIRHERCNMIDSHFAYPDGVCANLLGRIFKLPVSVTLRGTEPKHLRERSLRRQIIASLRSARLIIAVSTSLKNLVVENGISATKVRVVGNGVDCARFKPVAKRAARAQLDLPQESQVLITIGALVERKGFHRVIALLPALLKECPQLIYLAIGGAGREGDYRAQLVAQAKELGVADRVKFLGEITPDDLHIPLSASDIFVLASSNEGWANVILEAMACGLPVIASDVGGNAEVVQSPSNGSIYPFGDDDMLKDAIVTGLRKRWDRDGIIEYARQNSWDDRVRKLVAEFDALVGDYRS